VFARTDSGVRQLQDLNGQSFAFSDETSTSGHIFPRLLLEREGVSLGRVYYAGGHPNVVQAVWDGKALGGSAFYSPASPQQRAEGLVVGDARYLLMKRMPEAERRSAFLEEVRILRKTDPIPNDLCAARRGFPEAVWRRFADSLARYLDTEEGRETLFDLLAGVAAEPTDDTAFDGFRAALATSGMSADTLLAAEEEKLEKRKQSTGGDS
jgi:phosphonate transport system substrate-binding protein